MTFPGGVPARQEPLRFHDSGRPVPLAGVPLGRGTGLHLVVADKPPVVLDVDAGSVTPVRGVPSTRRGTVSIVGVGERAAVIVAEPVWRYGQLYAIRGSGARVARLGTGAEVVPAFDGRSVWVKRFVRPAHCTLRQVALDGRVTRTPKAFPCRSTIEAAGSLGLVVNRTRIVDPLTGHTVFRTPLDSFNVPFRIAAVAGAKVVLEDGRELTLLDVTAGAQQRLPWPNTVGTLDQPAVDARGRFVALAFGNPSWTSEAGQAFDVWLLDTETGELTQLPDMPAFVALKRTSMVWTPDGRLVFLAESGGKDMVAVWRPGQPRLAVKTVRLPDRSKSGSDSFALLR